MRYPYAHMFIFASLKPGLKPGFSCHGISQVLAVCVHKAVSEQPPGFLEGLSAAQHALPLGQTTGSLINVSLDEQDMSQPVPGQALLTVLSLSRPGYSANMPAQDDVLRGSAGCEPCRGERPLWELLRGRRHCCKIKGEV